MLRLFNERRFVLMVNGVAKIDAYHRRHLYKYFHAFVNVAKTAPKERYNIGIYDYKAQKFICEYNQEN